MIKCVKQSIPYVFIGLIGTNLGEAIRMSTGADASVRLLCFMQVIPEAFRNILPSLHPFDMLIGAAVAGIFYLIIQRNQSQPELPEDRQGTDDTG